MNYPIQIHDNTELENGTDSEWVLFFNEGSAHVGQLAEIEIEQPGHIVFIEDLRNAVAPSKERTAEDRENWLLDNRVELRWNATEAGGSFIELTFEHSTSPLCGRLEMFITPADAINYAMDLEELRNRRG